MRFQADSRARWMRANINRVPLIAYFTSARYDAEETEMLPEDPRTELKLALAAALFRALALQLENKHLSTRARRERRQQMAGFSL